MVAEIDEPNKLITLKFISDEETASLRLLIVGKSPYSESAITYLCEGVKSNLIDDIVVRKINNGDSMMVMTKCKNDICPNGTLNFNK